MRRAGLGLLLVSGLALGAGEAVAYSGGYSVKDDAHATRASGFYVGGHIGGGFGKTSTPIAADLDGVTGGVHLGYNYHFGRWFIGAEVDGDIVGVSERGSQLGFTAELTATWLSTLRARLGVEAGGLIVYATAGGAWSQMEASLTGPGLSASVSDIMSGWALGGGLELALTPAVLARAEVLHIDFGGNSYEYLGRQIGYDVDFTLARAGLSFKLY